VQRSAPESLSPALSRPPLCLVQRSAPESLSSALSSPLSLVQRSAPEREHFEFDAEREHFEFDVQYSPGRIVLVALVLARSRAHT
jgi:hypothetical protein